MLNFKIFKNGEIYIHKDSSIIKFFELFWDVDQAFTIHWGKDNSRFVYKIGSKPVMKGKRVESVEVASKEYAELLGDN